MTFRTERSVLLRGKSTKTAGGCDAPGHPQYPLVRVYGIVKVCGQGVAAVPSAPAGATYPFVEWSSGMLGIAKKGWRRRGERGHSKRLLQNLRFATASCARTALIFSP